MLAKVNEGRLFGGLRLAYLRDENSTYYPQAILIFGSFLLNGLRGLMDDLAIIDYSRCLKRCLGTRQQDLVDVAIRLMSWQNGLFPTLPSPPRQACHQGGISRGQVYRL